VSVLTGLNLIFSKVELTDAFALIGVVKVLVTRN